mmetsp:Transcript_61206/g.148054  ORF Transcript_61206/g.148054 Transcript_61206/m.148054 type:complete len:528 (+) Transcript_61206:150-1733(+)
MHPLPARCARLLLYLPVLVGQLDPAFAHQIARFNTSQAQRQLSVAARDAQEVGAAHEGDLWGVQKSAPVHSILGGLDGMSIVASMRRNGDAFAACVKSGLSSIIFGILIFLLAIPIQWFNEERSVRMDTLISRGLEECVSVDCMNTNGANRGKLVHVQGRAVGAVPVVDPQFQDALVKHCLKLQSTVEVFEWIQTSKTITEGKEKRTQPRFHTEWTTMHHDSMRFRKPILENPSLPNSLCLGTFTTTCKRVELGAFVLTDDMVNSFHKFEPAMRRLPSTITAHGHTFFANAKDGYYYMRPSASVLNPAPRLFQDHQVGDVRVHFMCVPDCDATVVAVQCKRDGVESFLPYRTIPRVQEREKLIEQGEGPLKDMRREIACCTGGVATCCCCPCNTIACCCGAEVVTEEIFFVSDQLDPREKPFQWVVRRNPCRVWNFRLVGWGIMLLGTAMILGPFSGLLRESPALRTYGGAATIILALIITFSCAALIMAAVYTCYRPITAMKWLLVIFIIMVVPLLWGGLGYKPSA